MWDVKIDRKGCGVCEQLHLVLLSELSHDEGNIGHYNTPAVEIHRRGKQGCVSLFNKSTG